MSSSSGISRRCPLCGERASLSFSSLPGFQEPTRFDVLACEGCAVSFVLPLTADDRVYDLIYRNAWKTPGYHEYSVFSDQVLRVDDPLAYLESVAPVYWAIGRFLRGKANPGRLRILEVGCGMGYLTYAVARSGFDIRGVDISPVAVRKAQNRYGDLFACADVFRGIPGASGGYDIVLCSEMIEHVEDPVSVCASLRDLLADGGELLLTTPNKSAFSKDAVWETDCPPVHLWWFTPASIESVARKSGFTGVEFPEFTGCPTGWVRHDASRDYSRPVCRSFFDRNGKLCFQGHRMFACRLLLRNLARRAGLLSFIVGAKGALLGGKARPDSTEPSGHSNICAVLKK